MLEDITAKKAFEFLAIATAGGYCGYLAAKFNVWLLGKIKEALDIRRWRP